MTRSTLAMTLLFAVGISACGRKAAREEAARQAAADSAQRVAAADSARRAQELARVSGIVGEQIHFAFDRSLIRAADRPILDRKVELLKADSTLRIQIAGHCDTRGPVQYNQRLGMRRATAAKQYLTRAGIAAGRIDVVSYGETRPLDPGTTREANARNRRDEFTIVAGGPAARR
jgi:peptidoglycan-associated lipoprotein